MYVHVQVAYIVGTCTSSAFPPLPWLCTATGYPHHVCLHGHMHAHARTCVVTLISIVCLTTSVYLVQSASSFCKLSDHTHTHSVYLVTLSHTRTHTLPLTLSLFLFPPSSLSLSPLCTEVAAKFFSACNHGDVDTIKHLLKQEPYARKLVELTNSEEPNAKKIAEKTIYTATLRGHYSAAKVLLEAGANARVNTGYGTPIYAAVKSGSLDLVRLLIEYRADFQSGKGFSPLFVACIEGRLSILRYLVDLGANLYAFTNPPLVFTACTAASLKFSSFSWRRWSSTLDTR